MRQWAVERWPENSDIYLERDLPRVKDEIRQHHADEAERARLEAEEEEELLRQQREAILNGTL